MGAAKEQSGDVARVAAIDGDGWTGAGSAPVADCARLRVAPSREGDGSIAPTHGGSVFAACASLLVHAAIVVAAALSLGAPQPTGAPEAIAVELVASTSQTPTPAQERQSTDAALAPYDEITAAAPAAVQSASPAPPPPPSPPAAPREIAQLSPPASTKASDMLTAATPNADPTAIPVSPEIADASEKADIAPPAPPPSPAPSREAERSVVTSIPPPQAASAPPEVDFSPPVAAPRIAPRVAPRPQQATTQAAVRAKPTARLSNARAEASAAAPARAAADPAAYRNALLAKIWSAVRYPEAARERGATGVATVRFALDGAGVVTLADVAQSSGDRALDDEAVAAVRRASPLPSPPISAPHAYSAPIRFELR